MKALLANDPYPRGSGPVKKLKGPLAGSYHLRSDPYRFLFDIIPESKTVHVFDVDTRGQVYK